MNRLIVLLTQFLTICSRPSSNHVVDLTLPLSSSSIYWPGNPNFKFTIIHREVVSDYWYESNKYETAEHGGTHLDSPSHFAKDKWRVHEIPVEKLIGPGVIINVTKKVEQDSDYRLQITDLADWEKKYGRIPDSAIVIMKTGWSLRHQNATEVFNTNDPSDSTTFHFPGLGVHAVKWLLNNRNISMIGLDTPSTDYGQSRHYEIHRLLGRNNIPGLENIAYLEKIPESGATIFVGVVKLHDGSGGQARIVASFPANIASSSATRQRCLLLIFAIFIVCKI